MKKPLPFMEKAFSKVNQIKDTPRKNDALAYTRGWAVRKYVQGDNVLIPDYNPNFSFENFGKVNPWVKEVRRNIAEEQASIWLTK